MIPQIIHQIWLSPPMPEKYTAWGRMLREMHPGWDVRFWTPDNLEDYDAVLDHYDLRGYHPALASDVFRIRVALKYGGFYLDCDCEPIGPLDPLRGAAFVCRSPEEPAAHFAGREVRINTGDFFGAPPGSPLLASYIERCEKMRSSAENILFRYGFLGLSEHLWARRAELTTVTRRELDERYVRHHSDGGWLSPEARANYRPAPASGPLHDPFKRKTAAPSKSARPWPSAEGMLRSNRGGETGCCSRPGNWEMRRR